MGLMYVWGQVKVKLYVHPYHGTQPYKTPKAHFGISLLEYF